MTGPEVSARAADALRVAVDQLEMVEVLLDAVARAAGEAARDVRLLAYMAHGQAEEARMGLRALLPAVEN